MGEIGVWWSSGSWIATGRPSSSTNAGPKFAEDALGKAILDDGKSTIQALSALVAKFEEGSLPADTCRPNLLEVFRTKKLAVQLVSSASRIRRGARSARGRWPWVAFVLFEE